MAEPKNPYVFRNGEWVDTRVPSEKTKENLISDTPENPKKPLPSGGKAPPGKNLISDIPENPKKPLPSGGKPTDPKKPVKPPVDKGPISDIPENPKKPLPGGGKPADPVKPPPAPPAPQQYYMTPTGPGGFIPPQQYAQNQTFETDNYSRPTPITPRAPVDKGPISDVPERPGDSINPRKPVATVNPWKNGEFIDTRVPGENGGETPIKPVDPKVPIDPKNPKTPINPPKDNPGPTPGITDVPERPGVGINERPSYGGTPKSSIPGVSDLYTAPTAPQSPMDPVKGVQAPITQKGLAAPIVPTTPNAFISGGGGANTPIVGGGGGSSSGGRNGESGGGRAGWIGGGGGGPPVVGPVNPTNPITPLPGGEKPETPKPTPTPGQTPTGLSIVPGKAGPGQINIVDWAGQVANDPTLAFRQDDPKTPENESMMMSDRVPIIDPNTPGTLLDPSDPRYQVEFDKLRQKAAQVSQTAVGTTGLASTTQATASQAGTALAGQQANGGAAGYNTQQTQAAVTGQDMTAAQGTLSDGSKITAPQLDMKGSGTGINADGSVNQTGKALNDYAKQNFSTIIDTSSPSGKALANLLGDGNYTDAKATAKGQLDILQSEFQDAQGNPKIPAWAAGVARNVGKIAAFKGMTGTAATAAMSQALMEASIPIAQADAQFFQTLTLQNLSNKQSSIINKANVLSKFDLANLDNRMAAAVENSKAFLQMDLANLDNRQQAAVINNQNRVQSILEDAKAVNTQRMFEADSKNDMDKFYGELNSNIAMYNTGQLNAMSQFNTSEKNQTSQFNANAANQTSQFNSNQLNEMSQFNASEINKTNAQNMAEANAMKKFNADLENQREQYYKNMQYNIDISNANWRQSVTKDNATMKFEAAATDVKNMVGIQQEELNRVWDRSDSLLDYLWKSAESELDRRNLLTLQSLKDKNQGDREDKSGFGSIIGTLIGKAGESFFNGFNW